MGRINSDAKVEDDISRASIRKRWRVACGSKVRPQACCSPSVDVPPPGYRGDGERVGDAADSTLGSAKLEDSASGPRVIPRLHGLGISEDRESEVVHTRHHRGFSPTPSTTLQTSTFGNSTLVLVPELSRRSLRFNFLFFGFFFLSLTKYRDSSREKRK